MEGNQTDKFEISKENPFSASAENNNFFLMDEIAAAQPLRGVAEHTRRLNDYDFNLLKEDAYKEVDDDLFKLEYKISKTEEEMKSLEHQIQAARDIHDFNLAETLINRKKNLEEDYKGLLDIYNEKSLSARISDSISNIFWGGKLKKDLNIVQKAFSNLTEAIMSKLPKKFSSSLEIRNSLSKLENINKSVDELMTMNIPYGENIDKYEQLSKYIIKANSIQNNIAKAIGRK